MNITIIGTGYVGLVTGVSLSEIGHHVTCVDIDEVKIEKLRSGISTIYEPGLSDLMVKNNVAGRLNFSTNHAKALAEAEVVYIAVESPEKEDGSVDLSFIESAVDQIAKHIDNNVVVVTKSTVPVGTNHRIKSKLPANTEVASNPEFLREGSAIHDVFHGDRIVIGADSPEALKIMREINKPFEIPILETDLKSAEMIKYASNAFLATKISLINEIANICARVGADIEEVALGMGLDSRIGTQFLKAGIGYGGSCFPKDTKALQKIAEEVDYDFGILKAVMELNQKQQLVLLDQAIKDFGNLEGKTIGVLGLAFKPNTDDIRNAASLVMIPELLKFGANVKVYDPVAMDNAKKLLQEDVILKNSVVGTIDSADIVFILTEWDEIRELDLQEYVNRMKTPHIYDGRNCYSLDEVSKYPIRYFSIGRKYLK
ncbi:UDP-glucose dehydrogenase family protein [Peribacillus alkalitolerans]|uniref:UDP-glucose dehydrogenase family protein n=1 Tax=Peribacillus alkalitolerans TaxID=1550385 RepID=UPI0013CFBEA5|nr:UDP-glucose/GDP-mannose dehydrogenase family protein [Peribacillus alkalitolerans]